MLTVQVLASVFVTTAAASVTFLQNFNNSPSSVGTDLDTFTDELDAQIAGGDAGMFAHDPSLYWTVEDGQDKDGADEDRDKDRDKDAPILIRIASVVLQEALCVESKHVGDNGAFKRWVTLRVL